MQKIDKLYKTMRAERDKLKTKIIRMKNRKLKVVVNQKLCRNCRREYLESENFNWSCRTHQSDWGGAMWWCCGKTSVHAAGCKFAKHECKEEEEEDEEQKSGEEILKYLRCMCCKEVGHKTAQCEHDPNLRTDFEIAEEPVRVDKLREFKKLNSESVMATTTLLNHIAHKDDSINNVFGMGALAFDDYNYGYYNMHLLIHERNLQSQETIALVTKQAGEVRLSAEILKYMLDRQESFKNKIFHSFAEQEEGEEQDLTNLKVKEEE